ncbi:dynactin-associated protein [Cavia porcellus]|uniref:dynactin-associated protein n=1 Tax=Cavia porcellus TaxID=10141 RepID=UPI00022B7FDF|nr:dynactin-associated protein-like [Cavia porcellus]
MDRKHGKYTVNAECAGNQMPNTCPQDQEAHSSTGWCPPSNEISSDVSSNLSGILMSPGILAQSRCPQAQLTSAQMKRENCSNWSLWKVFLACLLACVITTAIGVLIVCLVNNEGNNSPIVIQLLTNSEVPTAACTTPATSAETTTAAASSRPTTPAASTSAIRATTSSQAVTAVHATSATGSTAVTTPTETTATAASTIIPSQPANTRASTSREGTIATSATGSTPTTASSRALPVTA